MSEGNGRILTELKQRKEELHKTEELIQRKGTESQEKYLENIQGEVMEFQRTQPYELMQKTKELGYRENRGIKNICFEIPRGNKMEFIC